MAAETDQSDPSAHYSVWSDRGIKAVWVYRFYIRTDPDLLVVESLLCGACKRRQEYHDQTASKCYHEPLDHYILPCLGVEVEEVEEEEEEVEDATVSSRMHFPFFSSSWAANTSSFFSINSENF